MNARSITVAIAVVVVLVGSAHAGPPSTPPSPDQIAAGPVAVGHSKLSPLLNQLYEASFGLPRRHISDGLRHLVIDGDSVRVVVTSRPDRRSEAATVVSTAGGTVESTHRNLVFATVPIHLLHVIADADAVGRVRTPFRSRPDVVSEGVGLHDADVMHGRGLTGSGIKIGVLDCGGFTGYDVLLGSELPASVTLWTGGSDPSGVGDDEHGTACAEIVHDMAPGAELYLAHDGTEADYYAAFDWLIAQGVDVVSYSCGWLGEFPGDGAGEPHNPVNQQVSEARAAGILVVTSSGNYAYGANWQGWYVQLPGYTWHDFDGDWSNRFGYLYAGTTYFMTLTWNDWPADPLTQGSSSNYNLELWYWDGAAWHVVASSYNPQTGAPGDLPYEEISYTPTADEWYYVVIDQPAASSSHYLSLRSFRSLFQHFNASSSVYTPETPDVLSVGAVFWVDTTLEPFSSQGPLFGPGGTEDGGGFAPQIAACDGVSTVSKDASDGLPWPNGDGFFGTSAACPHVAGGAALLLEANPGMTVDALQQLLESTAIDMGQIGPDPMFGHGLMSLDPDALFVDGFESGDTSAWSNVVSPLSG